MGGQELVPRRGDEFSFGAIFDPRQAQPLFGDVGEGADNFFRNEGTATVSIAWIKRGYTVPSLYFLN
ncbi:hypothetical protein WNZ15_26175 [Roseibium sp. AS2]|uniref:hypothetical protein n=1 Tax=Roseibium sp. AS2 TaxID=3135781 RepID=UPI00316BC725